MTIKTHRGMTETSQIFLVLAFIWFVIGVSLLLVIHDNNGLFVAFGLGVVLFALWGLYAGINSLEKGISVNIGDRHPISIDSLGKKPDEIKQKLGGDWKVTINNKEEVGVQYDSRENKDNYIRIPIHYESKGEAIGRIELRMSFSELDLFYSVDIATAKLIFSRSNYDISDNIYKEIIKKLEE